MTARHIPPDQVQYIAGAPARPGVDAVPPKYVHLESDELVQWVVPENLHGGHFEAYAGPWDEYEAQRLEGT